MLMTTQHLYLLFAFLVSTAVFLPSTFAQNCAADYAAIAADVRVRLLRPLTPPEVVSLEGEKFTLTHILGSSMSVAYLGRDSFGRKVVVKKIKRGGKGVTTDLREFLRMEALKTKILREMGEDVPPIFWSKIEDGILVRAYEPGLTFPEIQKWHGELGITYAEQDGLEKKLRAEMKRVRGLRSEAEARMRAEGVPNPWGLDVKEDNFLYSFQKKKWIFFDP